MTGRTADGRIETVRVVPDGSPVANYGFDVTPARLVTGLITERGVVAPTREAFAEAFIERAAAAVRRKTLHCHARESGHPVVTAIGSVANRFCRRRQFRNTHAVHSAAERVPGFSAASATATVLSVCSATK